jgi:ATP-dependent DNA helicase RecG
MKLEEIEAALDAVAAGTVPEELEGQTLDFKQDPATVPATKPGNPPARLVELLIEAVVCFANAQGGTIVLGVADRVGGTTAFVGTQTDPDWLRAKLFHGTRPNLVVGVRELHYRETRLVLIDVPEGLDLYTDSKGRALARSDSSCRPIPEEARRALAWERRNPDATARPSQLSPADLDPEAMAHCRDLLSRLPDERSELARLRTGPLLRRLGLTTESGGLILAAEILFARPAVETVTYLRRSAAGVEPQPARAALPLVLAHRWLLARVETNRRTEITRVQLPDGQELAIPDYPILAVDEAVTNALAHRDWLVEQPVVVDHSPQALRVWSPGGLPPGVEVDRLLSTVSRPRSPRLMNAMRILGLAEATSRGVDRMYREMVRTGRDGPTIQADDFSVEVVFTTGSPNRAFTSYVARLPSELRQNTHLLLVLHAFCQRRTLRTRNVAELLQVPAEEAAYVLAWMASSDVALIARAGGDGGWRLRPEVQAALGSAVRYRTRIGGGDEQVVNHLKEYGWITNRTIRNIFHLDVQQARAMLSDLQSRRVVVKDPDGPARGPGVRWLAGPAAG